MTDLSSKAQKAAEARRKALERLDYSLNQRSLDDIWSLGQLESDWIYAMRFRTQNGRWVVGELRVFPNSKLLNSKRVERWLAEPLEFVQEIPLGGLTARQLRRIPFGKPIAAMDGLMKAARAIAQHYRKSGDRDLKLLPIAEAYVACLRRRSRRPTADCAQQMGLSGSQVRDAVHQARKQGLLTSSRGQGFAGGELTPRALALLQHYRATQRRRGIRNLPVSKRRRRHE